MTIFAGDNLILIGGPTPTIRYREGDQTSPAGVYNELVTGDVWKLQRASNASATTFTDLMTVDSSGDLTVAGTVTYTGLDVNGNSQFDGTITQGVDGTGYDTKLFGDTAGSYFLWDESGDRVVIKAGEIMIGGAESVAQRNSGESKLDINGSDEYPRISVTSYSADEKGAYLQLSTSQSDTIGTVTTTADTAVLGYIRFEGVDTSNNFDLGASIHSVQDGSAGARVPADLIFSTSTSSSPSEKMRILSTGLIGMGTSAPDHLLSLVNTPATSQVELRGGATAGGGFFLSNYGNQSGVMSTGVRVNAGAWTADTTLGGGSGSASIYLQSGSSHVWYSNDSTTDGNNISPTQVFTITSNGNASLLNILTCVSVTETSDIALKTNIETIPNALEKINLMRGVSFERIDNNTSSVGLIAQELEKIAPELVSNDQEYKSISYSHLTAYLIEAIKELNNEIKELKGN